MEETYYGIDIGGTKISLVIGNKEGKVLKKEFFPTPSVEDSLAKMIAFGKQNFPFVSIGISCGSPLDSTRGIILSPPNLPLWDHIEICSLLNQEFHVPCFLMNDANACALAEYRFGAGKGSKDMIFLTFGTGMGAGLILDGKLYLGSHDNAGEVGHMRLRQNGPIGYHKKGSFEGFCSGGGIARLGKKMALDALKKGIHPVYCPSKKDLDTVSAKTIAMAAKKKDETALKVYDLCGQRLGEGLAILMDILNPDTIVIGSIYQRSGELLIPSMKKALTKEALPSSLEDVKIVPSLLGDTLGDIACLTIAIDGVKKD